MKIAYYRKHRNTLLPMPGAGGWVLWDDTVEGYIGLLFQPGGLWIGAHWSRHNKRLCINLLPCLTVWVTLPGGKCP